MSKESFTIKVGPLNLDSCLWLAPLAGYTNLAFRLLLREIGGLGLSVTQLIHPRSLLEFRQAALELIQTSPQDQPLAVQLVGSNPDEMINAAKWLEDRGYAAIDINMGCPAPKICRLGGGAALLTRLDEAVRLAEKLVKSVKIPVTAKIRLGWTRNSIVAPVLVSRLEEVGIAAVVIHARTKEDGFSGPVDWEAMRITANSIKTIPVLGNGGITTPQEVLYAIKHCGCSGVSIGRGAFYDPWIFKRSSHYLKTGEILPPSTLEEKLQFMSRHFDLMIDMYGEQRACIMFRKIAHLYMHGVNQAAKLKRNFVSLSSREDFYRCIDEFLTFKTSKT